MAQDMTTQSQRRLTVSINDGPRPFSASKIAAVIREMGWRSALLGSLLFASEFLRSWWWDRLHNVTTRHPIPLSKLDLVGPSSSHAVFYQATGTKFLPSLLRRLDIQYSHFSFVDIGAGKGKMMLLAAEFPFRRIVGVELSRSLSDLAQRNCKSFRSKKKACGNFEVLCRDAAEFTFPNGPLVIYMFNPFDDVVLAQMLSKLASAIRQQACQIFLIYNNPLHRNVVCSSGPFERVLQGTDKWDYRKLRYEVYRSRIEENPQSQKQQ